MQLWQRGGRLSIVVFCILNQLIDKLLMYAVLKTILKQPTLQNFNSI